jgi:hypothetical protein
MNKVFMQKSVRNRAVLGGDGWQTDAFIVTYKNGESK